MIDVDTKEKIWTSFQSWRSEESKQYKEILGNKYASKQDKSFARERLNELYPAFGEVNPLSFGKFIEDLSDSSK